MEPLFEDDDREPAVEEEKEQELQLQLQQQQPTFAFEEHHVLEVLLRTFQHFSKNFN